MKKISTLHEFKGISPIGHNGSKERYWGYYRLAHLNFRGKLNEIAGRRCSDREVLIKRESEEKRIRRQYRCRTPIRNTVKKKRKAFCRMYNEGLP